MVPGRQATFCWGSTASKCRGGSGPRPSGCRLCPEPVCRLPAAEAAPCQVSTCCVPGPVLAQTSGGFSRSGEGWSTGEPRSPASPQLQLPVCCGLPGGCLEHSWEQMLGLEVKRSRLMIDDADLQPEVVHFGEKLGRPMHPHFRCPAHRGDPSFHPVCSQVQHASFTHSEAHHVFVLGQDRQGPGPRRGKGGGKQGTDSRSVRLGESGTEGGEAGAVGVTLDFHCLTRGSSHELVSQQEGPAVFRGSPQQLASCSRPGAVRM